jgi:uncharacterized protein YacL
MLFVEIFRFLFVLGGSVGGLEIGSHVGNGTHSPLIGMMLGAAISYVIGGVVGRLLDKGLQRAVFLLRNMPPGEVFAASIIATTGLLLGLTVGLPLLTFYRSGFEVLITAAVSWVLATLGWRLGAAKGRQVVAAAGLSRILAPAVEPPPGYALLVDASAIMDRFLLVLGRSGLLPGGLVVPQFVVDQIRTLADGPDPVSSRRARRGLESLEALREAGVPVHVAPDEVPEVDDATTKLVTVSRRLGLRIGTCSAAVVETAGDWDLLAVDLRRITGDLTPDHPPGEHLVIDLVKEGRQPRQAVGYLADGDMVVVNDALHLVGSSDVEVVVLSTRPTNQGLLVFARLSFDSPSRHEADLNDDPSMFKERSRPA